MSKHSSNPQPATDTNVVDLYRQLAQEPRARRVEAIRRAGGSHRSLEQLVERLELQADRLEQARDPACVFTRALARVNHRLADGLLRSGWDDPDWVALLALTTADHYLRALQSHAAGEKGLGVWASLFEASGQRHTSVREELVLGMTAHFVHDLPYALAEVGLHSASAQSRLRDYHAMNDPIGLAVEDLQSELTRRYEPWFAPADTIQEGYACILSNEGMRVARATAWYNAERLLHEQMRSSAQASLRRWPLMTLYELLHPPVWSARFATRRMRLMSNLARCWPGKRPGLR